MKLVDELNEILEKKQKAIDKEVINFFHDLLKVSPVDTGAFRSAWKIDKISENWKISNNMEYASILWLGRRWTGDRWIGSEQWKDGGEPMLQELNNKIQDELNKI